MRILMCRILNAPFWNTRVKQYALWMTKPRKEWTPRRVTAIHYVLSLVTVAMTTSQGTLVATIIFLR